MVNQRQQVGVQYLYRCAEEVGLSPLILLRFVSGYYFYLQKSSRHILYFFKKTGIRLPGQLLYYIKVVSNLLIKAISGQYA